MWLKLILLEGGNDRGVQGRKRVELCREESVITNYCRLVV